MGKKEKKKNKEEKKEKCNTFQIARKSPVIKTCTNINLFIVYKERGRVL